MFNPGNPLPMPTVPAVAPVAPEIAPVQATQAPAPLADDGPPPLPPPGLFSAMKPPEPKPPKPDPKKWDASIVRKAQTIYPAEAQAKQQQIDNAKMPTPSGAWGSPK